MTNHRIVWKNTDGTIAVTIPAPKGRRKDEKESDWFERVALKAQPSGSTRLPDCMAETLPKRYFRNCWRDVNGKVEIDMPLARNQKMNEIKDKRNELLNESDKEHLRLQAVGTDEQKQKMETYRQSLRDIPQNVDLEVVTDSDSLEVFEPNWPTINL